MPLIRRTLATCVRYLPNISLSSFFLVCSPYESAVTTSSITSEFLAAHGELLNAPRRLRCISIVVESASTQRSICSDNWNDLAATKHLPFVARCSVIDGINRRTVTSLGHLQHLVATPCSPSPSATTFINSALA